MASVRLILIKNPGHQDVEMILNSKGHFLYKHPKVIFSQTLPLEATFERTLGDSSLQNPDAMGAVNFTKSRGDRRQAIRAGAKDLARNFKDLVLYAF